MHGPGMEEKRSEGRMGEQRSSWTDGSGEGGASMGCLGGGKRKNQRPESRGARL